MLACPDCGCNSVSRNFRTSSSSPRTVRVRFATSRTILASPTDSARLEKPPETSMRSSDRSNEMICLLLAMSDNFSRIFVLALSQFAEGPNKRIVRKRDSALRKVCVDWERHLRKRRPCGGSKYGSHVRAPSWSTNSSPVTIPSNFALSLPRALASDPYARRQTGSCWRPSASLS